MLPTTPNGHYYEAEAIANGVLGTTGSAQPAWPTNGGTVTDGSVYTITWRDKGPEVAIAGFPNSQQGFGRLSLKDVLSDYPARVFVDDVFVAAGGAWTDEFTVHDASLPVRIALVWSDPPAMWSSGDTAPNPPLVNNLDLSVKVVQSGNCVGRYVGNGLDAIEESVYHQPCTTGSHDVMNNVEIIRFFATPARGDTTFTVNVASAAGSSQAFSLVIWNAHDSAAAPPPSTPGNFVATGQSATSVALTWNAASGADSYMVQRSNGATDPFVTIGSSATTNFNDGGRSSMTTYLYRIRATNGAGVSDWVVDPATTITFTDPVLTPEVTEAKSLHVTELRQAVAAIRAAAGLSDYTWTDVPIVAGSTLITEAHVAQLRIALGEARSTLALAPLSFTDGTLTPGVSVLKAVHIQELRNGVQ